MECRFDVCGELFDKDNIRGGISQRDSLSCPLFVISVIPLAKILRKVPTDYTLKCEKKLNHLLFMDDLKINGKNESEVNALVSTVELFSTDIGMAFETKEPSRI